MKKLKFPWKKNLLKIPDYIEPALAGIASNDVVVVAVRKINMKSITSGLFSHLDISIQNNELKFPDRVTPNEIVGRYSDYNINGREIVRKDLPKYYKTWSIETPNFGDWSKGSHDIEFGKMTYPRDYYPPRFNAITIELLEDFDQNQDATFIFKSSEVLDKTDPEFNDNLLFNLNLLQENVGDAQVFSSDTSKADFIKTIQINWEILPPGNRDITIAKIMSGTKLSPKEEKELGERYDFLLKFNPIRKIHGINSFQRYLGVQISENLIVFENIRYGNAIYVMYEDWEVLSKISRIDLLKDPSLNYDRIIHSRNWKKSLYTLINTKLGNIYHFSRQDLQT